MSARHLLPRGLLAAAFALTAFAAAPAAAVEVERVVSPGGIEAWLVQDHSNPIISLDLAFRGGAALDPDGLDGLSQMTASLIDEGAGPLDSQAFQGELENLSIRLRFDAGLDNFSGELRTLTENKGRAFELLRLALTEPRFDTEPVERIRSQLLAMLARDTEDPDSIAGRVMRRLLFDGHPYARRSEGTPESISKVTADDMRRLVAERFGRDNLVIGVVGDIMPAELAPLLDSTFGGLPERAAAHALPEAEVSSEGGLVVIEKPIPQSIVAIAQPGIKRDDPDYYAAYVVNHIFGGGGFTSRLYQKVREERGLAYSVYSYLSAFDHAALLSGGVATQNGRVAESLALIREEWRRFSEEGPSARELEDAKTHITGAFPLRLSSTGAIAGLLVGMQLEELGIDYIDRRNSFIEAVTLEDARRVARRLFRPDALSIVVVGQPDGVIATRPAPEGAS